MASGRTTAAAVFFVALLVLCLGVAGCGSESDGGSESGEVEALESGSAAAVESGDAEAVESGDSAAVESASVGADIGGEAGLPVLLDLGSTTCIPCKAMAPILDEMRETFAGQLDVRFVDVKADGETARKFGVRIIPTQIFLDGNGDELFRHQGFFSREDMLAAWAELGYVFEE